MVLIPRPPDPIDDTDKAKNIIFIPCETSTFHCKFYSLPCSCVILIISVSPRYGFLSFASACYMWNISCPLETSLWLFPGQSVRHGWYRLTALEDRSDDRSKNILLRQTRVNTASRWAMSWRRSQNEISGSAKFLKKRKMWSRDTNRDGYICVETTSGDPQNYPGPRWTISWAGRYVGNISNQIKSNDCTDRKKRTFS